MAAPNEKLAAALESLKALQDGGRTAIRSSDLSRTVRERLVKNGFLQPVIKGWYVPTMPEGAPGETTAWYTAFWRFSRDYLEERFGADWSLTAEQSLILHAGVFTVPRQLLVRAPGANNQSTALLHGTSIFESGLALPPADDRIQLQGLRLYTVAAALVSVPAGFFETHPTEARTVLSIQPDASAVLVHLLRGGHSTVAGRLAGAFRNIGRDREADAILAGMAAADHAVREVDPFTDQRPRIPYRRDTSPYAQRLRLLWARMREDVIGRLPTERRHANAIDDYLREVDALYVTDAYHSLSIEGYRVSPALIDRVRSGQWNPQANAEDRDLEAGLAASGYWQAFQVVRNSVRDVLAGQNPGDVVDRDHPIWYREMFTPKIAAGLLKPENLAGYRNGPVYLRGSRHVPLNADAVRDAMPTFFDLLREEADPAARIVLGHFIYVYIHPYFDGNGRTGRFLMNVMMAAAGYPWTVIPVEERDRYMAALEAASVDQDIRPFADFIAARIRHAREIRAPDR